MSRRWTIRTKLVTTRPPAMLPMLTYLFLLLVTSPWQRRVDAHALPSDGARLRTLHRLAGGHMFMQYHHHRPFEGATDDDFELMTSSAGGGREGAKANKDGGDGSAGGGGEEKKTLSQQVADGKYGLIQKELFSRPVKKPGVLSYEHNPEVPEDTINNLGGLTKHDIWLAENHLLVIKGGSFPTHELDNSAGGGGQTPWVPIDDYVAPSRQVKLPAHPKIPPPFPVQLSDDGPLQILGTNYTTTLNGTFAAAPYPLPPAPSGGEEGYFYPPVGPYPANVTTGHAAFPISAFPAAGGDFAPAPPPSSLNLSALPPFFASLPPGAAVLPPPNNLTDLYDEDDPSIYYPPPYSFIYHMENTTLVPPGPLVPGIVLPPPPNFFAPLEKPSRRKPVSSASSSQRTRPTAPPRITTTTELIKQIVPTTTPSPATPVSIKPPYVKVKPIDFNDLKPPPSTYPTRVVTVLPVRFHSNNKSFVPITSTGKPYVPVVSGEKRPPKQQTVTILKPVKMNATPPPAQHPQYYFYENNEVSGGKSVQKAAPPKYQMQYEPPARTVVTSTQVPLKAYYATSSPNEIDTNSVHSQLQSDAHNKYYHRGSVSAVQLPRTTKSPPPKQYYFYEEESPAKSVTTQRVPKAKPIVDNYYIPKEYFLPAKQNAPRPPQQQQQQQQQQQPQYYYVNNRPYHNVNSNRPSRYRFIETTKKPTDSFSLHVARLKQQLHYYTTPNYYETTKAQASPKPVYQFSFQAANYKPTHGGNGNADFRASPQVNAHDTREDQFRPMSNLNGKFSVEIQPAVELVTPAPPIYQQTPSPVYYQQVKKAPSTERPVPSKYYAPTQRPDYEYEDVVIDNRPPPNGRYVGTPRPITQYSFDATQNPLYQPQYYNTKQQEESYFDDITKKYFTIFGKKLPGGLTTPLNSAEATTANPRPVVYHQQKQIQYAQSGRKPPTLEGDTLVNYVPPRRRPNNPQAEYIPGRGPNVAAFQVIDPGTYFAPKRGPNAASGTAEIVQAIPVKVSAAGAGNVDKPEAGGGGAFISYELPGDDGAHFYFLTPQLAQRRDQGAGFYYDNRQDAARVPRSENIER